MDIALRIAAFPCGVALIVYFFRSVIRVGMLNQRYMDSLAFWISRFVYRIFRFRLTLSRRSEEREHSIMAWYWPCTLIAIISAWFLLVTLGFAFLNWSLHANPSFVEAFVSSGSALSTLGFSTPSRVIGQFIAIFEGAIGLFLIVYLFTFLPGFMQLIHDRGERVSWICQRAGSEPSGTDFLVWLYRNGRGGTLDDLAEDWETFFRDLSHARTFHPILAVVRSLNPGESWPAAFGAFLDALALVRSTFAHPNDSTGICFRSAVAAVQSIRFSLRRSPLAPHHQGPLHVTRGQYDSACHLLGAAGIPLREDHEQSWLDFIEHHKLYEEEIIWLATTLGSPVPRWPAPLSPDTAIS